MEDKFEKDVIILKLLNGWEIIHLSKSGKKVSIRLREFPDEYSRFFRITFVRCSTAVLLNFNKGKIEDITSFDFKGCVFSNINIENYGLISIHLLKQSELIGALKISPGELKYDFTTK